MKKKKHIKLCRQPKRKPYGTTGTDPYCRPHDQCSVYVVEKGAERNEAKREILKERKRIGK